MATPASSQPAVKAARFGAVETMRTATTPRAEPAVITALGLRRSRMRPRGTPATADTSRALENAPVAAVPDHPVAAVIAGSRTGKA
ncbi:hypothetical protein N566_19350 [Streptomycetaceae bacterium MP113-05]|nr:hypothetical protein N566_19350 [Streptomycetaceae bacterium MP113-05]